MLHVTAHVNALHTRIIPWLKSGANVVLDRFYWSTWVYGVVYGANQDFLNNIVKLERSVWGEYLSYAKLFLFTRNEPFIKTDDANAADKWPAISLVYKNCYQANAWDDIHRCEIKNDSSIETCLQKMSQAKFHRNPFGAPTTLSQREMEIAALVTTGATNAQIAMKLNISYNTVIWHIKKIMRKLHVSNRTELTTMYTTLDLYR
jgi:DNA-binding CsgD family transcriptional regulator